MDTDEVMQACPLCGGLLVRRDHKPKVGRIGGVSREAQGLPPFWWYCRNDDEHFDGVKITRKELKV